MRRALLLTALATLLGAAPAGAQRPVGEQDLAVGGRVHDALDR